MIDAPERDGGATYDLAKIKAECDVIVANRWSDDLSDVTDKVYTRDLLKRDWRRRGFCLATILLDRTEGAYRLAPVRSFLVWEGVNYGSGDVYSGTVNTFAQIQPAAGTATP